MNIYFVRHGESEGNQKKYHQGERVALSKKGKVQAEKVAKALKKVSIDVIYSSPLLRTKQTAEIISKELKLPTENWENLKEQKRPSQLDGLSYDDPKAEQIKSVISKNKTKANWKYSDDESYNDLLTRAKEVEKHIFEHHRGQNVLCVSHMNILAMIIAYMVLGDKLTPEVYWQFYHHVRHKNTGITRMKHTNTFGWNLVTWNDTTHL